MNLNFIPCAKWVKRGVAKSHPEVIKFSKEELKELLQKAQIDDLERAEDLQSSCDGRGEAESKVGDEFNMDDYDGEDDVRSLIGIGNLMSATDILETSDVEDDDENEDDSEREDDEIKPTDNLIAVGRVQGDLSVLEVYVFNEEDDDLYVHHDIVLPSLPLSMEWLSSLRQGSDSKPGNLLAVGGMSPEITVWDLDLVNCLEPVTQLGEFSDMKKHQHRNYGHKDAVLDLACNSKLPHVLASGSVDRSVLLWDLNTGKVVSNFSHFNDKVQTLQWHPSEINLLAAGACDSTVRMVDCRVAESVCLLQVDGEVEKVLWHPNSQHSLLVGTSKGQVLCVDCRSGQASWSVSAHDKEITGLVVFGDNLVSSSTEETVKVWRLESGSVSLHHTRATKQGELQCLQNCPDNPAIICVGGNSQGNNFTVYNLATGLKNE